MPASFKLRPTACITIIAAVMCYTAMEKTNDKQ